MRYEFAHIFFANATVLEPEGTWIRAVVKAGLNPVARQNIILIFPNSLADKFGYKYAMPTIAGLKAQNKPLRGSIGAVFNLGKRGLGEEDQASIMRCSLWVQSSMPL